MTTGKAIFGVLVGVAAIGVGASLCVTQRDCALIAGSIVASPAETRSDIVVAVESADDSFPYDVDIGAPAAVPAAATVASSAPSTAPSPPQNSRSLPRTPDSFVLTLPPSLLELVRTIRWDEEASAVLERFVLATFDADGDGTIDDLERVHAVRAMRDAVWEDTAGEFNESMEPTPDPSPATLSEADRRLHHDVDQVRRRENADLGGDSILDAGARAAIVVRFGINDDGRVTASELSRYLSARRASLPAADLNADGRIDDSDLSVFLDVASPITED